MMMNTSLTKLTMKSNIPNSFRAEGLSAKVLIILCRSFDSCIVERYREDSKRWLNSGIAFACISMISKTSPSSLICGLEHLHLIRIMIPIVIIKTNMKPTIPANIVTSNHDWLNITISSRFSLSLGFVLINWQIEIMVITSTSRQK